MHPLNIVTLKLLHFRSPYIKRTSERIISLMKRKKFTTFSAALLVDERIQ